MFARRYFGIAIGILAARIIINDVVRSSLGIGMIIGERRSAPWTKKIRGRRKLEGEGEEEEEKIVMIGWDARIVIIIISLSVKPTTSGRQQQ